MEEDGVLLRQPWTAGLDAVPLFNKPGISLGGVPSTGKRIGFAIGLCLCESEKRKQSWQRGSLSSGRSI